MQASELTDQADRPWRLSDALQRGAVLLVFYRGDWCPYRNGQLAAMARDYGAYTSRGATIAGVVVDAPGSITRDVAWDELSFGSLTAHILSPQGPNVSYKHRHGSTAALLTLGT